MRILRLAIAGWAGCASPSTDVGDTDGDTDVVDTVPFDAQPLRMMLHGGGYADAPTFTRFVHAAKGGRIVTLGALAPSDQGYDEYNAWWLQLGAVEALTLNLPSSDSANANVVADMLAGAGAIYLRGGDLGEMRAAWSGTKVEAGLRDAIGRGVPVGGSAAGAALLAEQVVVVSERWELESYQAVADPIAPSFSLQAGLTGAIAAVVDTDVAARARLGRLAVFVERAASAGDVTQALGLDSLTSLLVWEDGTAEVAGQGAITLLRLPEAAGPASTLDVWHLPHGYTVDLRAVDPVVARPEWVLSEAADLTPESWSGLTLIGDDVAADRAGAWTVTGTRDPDGWWDGGLRVVEGSSRLPGLTVVPALFGDVDLFATRQAALWTALAANPGGVVLGLDVGTRVRVEGRSITPRAGDVAWVLDGRSSTSMAVEPDGWRSAAVEGATLRLVRDTWSADPTP